MNKEELAIKYANNLKATHVYLEFVKEKYKPPENVESCLNTMLELYKIMAVRVIKENEDETNRRDCE